MKSIFIVFLALLPFLYGCTKEEEPEIISSNSDTTFNPSIAISDTPSIAFESILPTNIIQYQDSVVIRFTYIDGNGDLGENNTETRNLFVTDSRNDIVYEYRIPQLSPSTTDEIAIQGNFEVMINTVALIDQNASSESLSYSLYVVDRAGNSSNTIETTNVTVNSP